MNKKERHHPNAMPITIETYLDGKLQNSRTAHRTLLLEKRSGKQFVQINYKKVLCFRMGDNLVARVDKYSSDEEMVASKNRKQKDSGQQPLPFRTEPKPVTNRSIGEQVHDVYISASKIRDRLTNALQGLPNNPEMNILVEGKAFIINSKDLQTSMKLDPFYHDWSKQHEILVSIVHMTEIENLMDRLCEIIRTHVVMFESVRYKFAPAVMTQLRDIINTK